MALPSSSVKALLHEKKYPFIFALSILFLSVVFILISSSQPSFLSLTSNFSSNFSPLRRSPDQHPPSALPDPPVSVRDDVAVDNSVEQPAPQQEEVIPPPAQVLESPMISPSALVSSQTEFDKDLMNLKREVCQGSVAVDYIPCLDNKKAIKALQSRRHMEHRERHCPKPSPRCLVPLPKGYKIPVPWPQSRDMIWYDNVPHPKLVD